jgi:hypothetical protein
MLVCAYYVDLLVGAYYIVMLVLVGAYYIVTLVDTHRTSDSIFLLHVQRILILILTLLDSSLAALAVPTCSAKDKRMRECIADKDRHGYYRTHAPRSTVACTLAAHKTSARSYLLTAYRVRSSSQ